MLSAPPVLVEPRSIVIIGEHVPREREYFEWATQTPELSPVSLAKAPYKMEDEHIVSLQNLCHPVFEQMLTRIASHADVLMNSEPIVRHQLVQALCQPFFEQVCDYMSKELSDVSSNFVAPKVTTNSWKVGKSQQQNLDKQLGVREDDSTDVEDSSAFATLFSSDGEECDLEARVEARLAKQSLANVACHSEEENESLQDVQKSQMVCRHWKAKGWCRFDSKCKFLHPEHKRGISTKGAMDKADNSSLCKSTKTKRGGKNKQSNKAADVAMNDSPAQSCLMSLPYDPCSLDPQLHLPSE